MFMDILRLSENKQNYDFDKKHLQNIFFAKRWESMGGKGAEGKDGRIRGVEREGQGRSPHMKFVHHGPPGTV